MITVRKLESGYWHIRGQGPCNFAQPKHWPCSEEELRQSAHPEAGDQFIRDVIVEADASPTGAQAAARGDDGESQRQFIAAHGWRTR